MAEKKDLRLLIARIKAATGLTQEAIAEEINYSAAHFSVMKRQNSTELYNLLSKHFEEPLKSLQGLEQTQYEIPDDDKLQERALLQACAYFIEMYIADHFRISEEAANDKLIEHTRAILNQMKMMVKLQKRKP